MTDNENTSEDFAAAQQEQVDYFGIPAKQRHILPDGVSWIEFKPMSEGEKAAFQKATSRDLIMERGTGNARVSVDPATERHALLEASITGWNLKRGNNTINFGRTALRDFLQLGNPKVVEDIETAIRKANPWLTNDLTVEEIDKEIDSLKELRETRLKADSEKELSSSK